MRLAFIAFMATIGPLANALDYCVDDVAGNAAAEATGLCDSDPWKTIAQVNSASSAGTFASGANIYFARGGVWSETITVNIGGGRGEEERVTYGAYGDGARPLIDVGMALDSAFTSYSSYITLNDIDFKNSKENLVSFTATGGNYGIIIEDVNISWDVRGAEVAEGRGGLTFAKGGSDNYVNRVSVTNARKQGISLLGSPTEAERLSNVLVENSEVDGAQDCFYLHEDANSNPAGSGIVIRYSFAKNCDEEGFDVTTGSDVLLYKNTSESNDAGAISIGHSAFDIVVDGHTSLYEPSLSTSAALSISTNNVIVKNSTFNGGVSHLIKIANNSPEYGDPSLAEDIQILNNTFVWQVGSKNMILFQDTIINLTVKGNVFTTATGNYGTWAALDFLSGDTDPGSAEYTFDENIYYNADPATLFFTSTSAGNFTFDEFKSTHGQELNGDAASAMVRYFATTGTDQTDCTLGEAGTPWRSLQVQYDAGCVLPGDTALVAAGSYVTTDPFFWTGGAIKTEGRRGFPVTIRAQTAHASDFIGQFAITGRFTTLEDIEIRDATTTAPLLAVGKMEGLVLENLIIHGTLNTYSAASSLPGDCIYVDSGFEHASDITISNSTVYDCSQDAIEFTSGSDITISGTEVYNASQITLIGGIQDIVFTANNLHDMTSGLASGAMDCSLDGYYCGDWIQSNLPVADRFQAADIKATGNDFIDIVQNAVDLSGWRRVVFTDNTLLRTSTDATFRTRALHTAFYDPLAGEYCGDFPSECAPCTTPSATCNAIVLRATDIDIMDNNITQAQPYVLSYDLDSLVDDSHPCFDTTNTVTVADPLMRVDGVGDIPLYQSPDTCSFLVD